MLTKVNLKDTANAVADLYDYHEIGRINGNVLTVARVENRTLGFHAHEKSDELFYVIEGSFVLETADETIELKEGEAVVVPRGTRHRPVVKALVKVLLMELDGTLDKNNS